MRVPVFVRKLLVRGRRSVSYFSSEGWPVPSDEPVTSVSSRRAQHYGFVSELTDDGEVIAVAINGGENNLAAVAEVVPGEPQIENSEVLLWTKHGQRVLLKNDGDVVVFPGPGNKVLLGTGDPLSSDPVVTLSDLNAKLATLCTWLNAHVHTTPGPPGPSSPPTSPIGTLGATGSPNVYAKKP